MNYGEIVWFTGKLVLVQVEKVVSPLILLVLVLTPISFSWTSVILLFYDVKLKELLSVETKRYWCFAFAMFS